MSQTPHSSEIDELPAPLALAFAPIHKAAFGVAVGLPLGTVLLVATLYSTIRGDFPDFMYLFSNYFRGYTVSWPGAFIGFGWMTFTGFVAGWFVAFCRNFALATSVWLARTRQELAATRDFLDHI